MIEIMLAVSLTAAAATSPGWSLPFSCQSLREQAAGLSMALVERSMRRHRLSERQKAEVRACLTEKST